MPNLMSESAPGTPTEHTIEYLLGQRNVEEKSKKDLKSLGELTDHERSATGIVRLGTRRTKIPGDPFGLYSSWAGNVSHPGDKRMLKIMPALYQQILACHPSQSKRRDAVQEFLAKVPTTEAVPLATESADNGDVEVVDDNTEETIVNFRLKSMTVRLMHCKDVDLREKEPFRRTKRYREALTAARVAFNEAPMSTSVQQLVMALRLLRTAGNFDTALSKLSNTEGKAQKILAELRSEAQEEYWLHSTKPERTILRQNAGMDQSADIQGLLEAIKAGWSSKWNNGRYDVDFFFQYLADKTAAEKVWHLVEADLFVVTDKKRRVIFANLEDATGLLFGDDLAQRLTTTIDMYSFFVPLPLPETKRHVVDRYVRRLHPELDPANATVEQLARAKMAVAHYGCWSMAGDPHGEDVFLTRDTGFWRSFEAGCYPRKVFKGFCRSVLGRCSDVIRFLVENLDPEYYALCRAVYDQLPEDDRVATTDKDFLSLFALGINGHTQRHRDTNDIAGGMAGLMTLGDYTGGNLCIPQLGFRVRYKPGACTVLRGDKMDHLVTDYSGPRYFVIGTNHESVRKHAERKMARAPAPEKADEEAARRRQISNPFAPADYRDQSKMTLEDSDDECENRFYVASEMEVGMTAGVSIRTPCVNPGCDDDDEEVANHQWTNEELHEAAALPLYDVSSSEGSQS
ncbi:hypothetical protein PG995_007733 [Apiospora arundinis]